MAKGGNKGLDSPPGACMGRSLVEMMEDELDDVYNRLMESPTDIDKGQALGLATAIAIVKAPYYPNIDNVRADCVRRYEWRQEQKNRSSAPWSSAGSRASEMEDLESGE